MLTPPPQRGKPVSKFSGLRFSESLLIFTVLLASLLAYFAYAIIGTVPSISFVSPTDSNGAYINRNWTYINVTVNDTETPNNLTAFIDWNRSLVLWMRFNNESGENSTFFRDWSSYGNNGTCSGSSCPNLTAGKFGNATRFDGVSSYIDAGNGASLNFGTSTDFSFSVWIKTGVTGQSTILRKMDFTNYYGYSIDVRNNGNLFLDVKGTNSRVFNQYLTTVSDNTWHYIMVTNNRWGNANIYVDNVYVGQQNISTIGNITTSANLYLGMDWEGAGYYYFNGTIDEVRIWNRALSPEEINASYNAGVYRLYHNFTNLTEGTYNYTAYVQDTDGNVNQTEIRKVTIDTLPPVISISSPMNVTYSTRALNLTASFDSDVPTAWYSVDGGANTTFCYNCSSLQATLNSETPSNTTGLVGWWKFNEGSGNQTSDSSGMGNTGNLTNMNPGIDNCTGNCSGWTSSGKFGNALQFDGVNDYVDAGNGASLNITNAITVEAWVKTTNNNTQEGIVMRGADNYVNSVISNNGRYSVALFNGSTNSNFISTAIVTDGIFHDLTFSYDGVTVKEYIDGIQVGSQNLIGPLRTITANWQIGKYATNYYFNGTIDEVRIYNRSLSATDIYNNYALSSALHNVTVYANNSLGQINSSVQYFTVNTSCAAGDTYGLMFDGLYSH